MSSSPRLNELRELLPEKTRGVSSEANFRGVSWPDVNPEANPEFHPTPKAPAFSPGFSTVGVTGDVKDDPILFGGGGAAFEVDLRWKTNKML